MFYYFSPEERVPVDHPLRLIRSHVDKILDDMSKTFDKMYSHTGRPSITTFCSAGFLT
jgi:transposase